MSKVNGVKDQAGASTSLYNKEHTPSKDIRQSSGLPSFFKWFKKNDNRKSQIVVNGTKSSHIDSRASTSVSQINGKYNSNETLSIPSSPILGYLSPSSSCDSVLSTSTTGFAFFRPTSYDSNLEPKTYIAEGSPTDTYKKRLRQHLRSREADRDVTLRRKYKLYDADTLKSNFLNSSGYDNVEFIDRSLPHIRTPTEFKSTNSVTKRRHRRTVSDSCKDRRSGAYVHVKGKRRAPPPPPLPNDSDHKAESLYEPVYHQTRSLLYGTISSASTLGRKKRRAPQPPSKSAPREIPATTEYSGDWLEDKDIRAIIEGTNRRSSLYAEIDRIMKSIPSTLGECQNPSKGLTEEQKQILIDNIVRTQSSHSSDSESTPQVTLTVSPSSENDKNNDSNSMLPTPVTPISPRPWYKRPISSNRESSIPFKREIVLKTMEKRKSKTKEKDQKSDNQLPEVGYSRTSIFDAGNKFGFFMRSRDSSDDSSKSKDKEKEKRRSGIGIPNISELDREAAAIVNKEHANVRAKQKAEDEKFFSPPEHLILQQQMFGSNNNVNDDTATESDDASQKITSTKDLISKFEATSNVVTRITLNTSFIGRKENFFEADGKAVVKENEQQQTQISSQNVSEPNNKELPDIESSKLSSIFNNMRLSQNSGAQSQKTEPTAVLTSRPPNIVSPILNKKKTNLKNEEINNITEMSWTCPFCTLENPNWRIICEVCERIKPYDKNIPLDTKIPAPNSSIFLDKQQPNKISVDKNETSTGKNFDNEIQKPDPATEWEKKAEKVKKYFMPSTKTNALAKSSSESTVGGGKIQPLLRKSPSPSRLPISSPKLGLRNRQNTKQEKPDLIKGQLFSNLLTSTNKIPEEKETNLPSPDIKKALLDSSAVITTVTPVFYASTAFVQNPQLISENNLKENEQIDLDEVRSARLAKFGQQASSVITHNPNAFDLSDHDSLEREKLRLREMIRAMNAKALAEKYPIIQKSISLDETTNNGTNNRKTSEETKDTATVEASKFGAIKKVFIKSRSPENKKSTSTPKLSQTTSNLYNEPPFPNRPQKVSSSAQTSAMVKTAKPSETAISNYELLAQSDFQNRKTNKINTNIYVNVPIYENNDFSSSPPTTTDANYANLKNYENQYIRFSECDKAKVKEISQQLKSAEGINDFKETLRNPTKGLSRTDTLALGKIMRNLELAIVEGNDELAAKIAVDLAKMKVSLHVTKQKNRPASTGESDNNRNIIVNIYVEDKISQKGPIQTTITPLLTILELKQKIFKDYEIPIEVQRWLINDELANENKKILLDYGVKSGASTFHLYLVSTEIPPSNNFNESNTKFPFIAKAVEEDFDDNESSDGSSDYQNDDDEAYGAVALPLVTTTTTTTTIATTTTKLALKNDINATESNIGWTCPLCTLINPSDRPGCMACSKARPSNFSPTKPTNNIRTKNFEMPDELKRFITDESSVQLRPIEKKNDLNKASPNRKSSDIFNIIEREKPTIVTVIEKKKVQTEPEKIQQSTNFSSPNITKIKYRGVYNFNPNRKDKEMSDPSSVEKQNEKGKEETKDDTSSSADTSIFASLTTNHYLELLSLDNADIVPNMETFECPVCFMKCEAGQGAVLRDCLHMFCKECLVNTVKYSEEAEVKCPYMDAKYSCESIIQEREIKTLVNKDIYEKHLNKSVRVAEHKIENAFHCKTPNCRGWCIYEDNVNQFKCPVCKITNCLTCRVIHDGLTCKQYQDRLNSDCDSNIEARRTKDMLREMVEKGEAMNCPTCQVIMMKKWGCDWLKCSMCKTEVCWVTRGPRWGPEGKGDTSSGCKCGIDGKKCHPKCNYCH